MGPISRSVKASKASPKNPMFYFPVWNESGEYHWNMVSYESFVSEGYKVNPIIYSAIMYKCRAQISAPLRAYTGQKDEPELLSDNDPLSLLTQRPNEFQSWVELQQSAITYLNLSGNAYIFMLRNRASELPQALYTLRPDRIKIIPNEGQVVGYEYRPDGPQGKAVPILKEDMIHVRLPNPDDPFEGQGYGLSPIMPSARSADVDNYITKFLANFFKRGGMGLASINYKGAINDKDVARMRERWMEQYGGVDNWHKPLILDQSAEYKTLTPTFKDLGFESLDGRDEGRILGPLGVPGMLIGIRSGMGASTFSNFEQADRVFWQTTMIPEMMLFEIEYQYALSNGGRFVQFDTTKVPALQRDIVPLVTAFAQLFNTGVPRRDAAATVGLKLPRTPGDEISYLPMGYQAVGNEQAPPLLDAEKPTPVPLALNPQAQEDDDPEAEGGNEEPNPKAQPPTKARGRLKIVG